jgi:glutamate N-acetyltransferase/amino-acid N-acetyltransferase
MVPEGFLFYSGFAGVYGKERPDILLISAPEGALAAGVFTTNRLKAAPVKIAEEILKRNSRVGGVLVNAGYANAATGKRGIYDARRLIEFASRKFKIELPLLPASTGVIGAYLPVEKFEAALAAAISHKDLELAARSIMTTDTFPKFKVVNGSGYLIAGITKGAGMIAPSMATTLTFILTDVFLPVSFLRQALLKATLRTYNRISVDGEQSTNDCILLLASQKRKLDRSLKKEFEMLLTSLLFDLSLMILKDGEGATKIIRVRAVGFRSENEAEAACKRIALSPLVKTAVYGGDPNWGRVYAALGDAGVTVDEEKLKIYFNDICVYDGGPCYYDEAELKEQLSSAEIYITVDAGLGKSEAYFYTCDLSERYVEINASYTS